VLALLPRLWRWRAKSTAAPGKALGA
jgi:hypothetical protein